jgi:dienelactone hydrolase
MVEVTYYPDAYHSFDGLEDRAIQAGGKTYRLKHDPVAAFDAEARTRAFFDKVLR